MSGSSVGYLNQQRFHLYSTITVVVRYASCYGFFVEFKLCSLRGGSFVSTLTVGGLRDYHVDERFLHTE